MDKIAEMKALIDSLNEASQAYYGGENELMSDHEWNLKFDRLEALEKETGVILDNSPTHNVSRNIEEDEDAVAHELPALSLDKSQDPNDLIRWAGDKDVFLSWKLDGMTLVVTYDNGKLTRVVTRGDGYTGYDITRLADAIDNLPKQINFNGHLVARGEAVISYPDFERVKLETGVTYENPRALVSGSLSHKIKSVEMIEDRGIIWIPFALVCFNPTPEDLKCDLLYDGALDSWRNRMAILNHCNIKTVDCEFVSNPRENLLKVIDRWSNKVQDFEYAVDGLVITYEDVKYAAGGTDTGHHNTRAGFAFKWADEEVDTNILDIEWSPSIRSINPVAIFEPKRIEGTSVSRASLCNVSEIERLGIVEPGQKIYVVKANKIIPKVVRAEASSSGSSWPLPDECPACHSKVELSVSENGIKTLVCTNPNCIAKHISKFERFGSRYGFNILGLSESTLLKFASFGLVSSFADILRLPEKEDEVREKIEGQVGIGSKTITNIMKSINKAKSVNADRFLYALCVPMCGRGVAKRLAKNYTMVELMFILETDPMVLFIKSSDIGKVKLTAFIDWFAIPENLRMVQELMTLCNIKDIKEQQVVLQNGGLCEGLTFVVTGALQNFKSKEEIQAYIESTGGKFGDSISKKVDFLITNDTTSGSKKNEKAKELGIPVISEDEFMRRFYYKE